MDLDNNLDNNYSKGLFSHH